MISMRIMYIDDIDAHTDLLQADIHTHLNSQNENIQFTIEGADEMKLPFLDALSSQKEDGHVSTKVYRKPVTHTD